MRYKSDFSDKAEEEAAMPAMPITCGGFNSGLSPAKYGNIMPVQNSMAMAAFQQPTMMPVPSTPTGFPTGATTTPLVPTVSGTPSGFPSQGSQGVPVMQGGSAMPGLPGSPGQPSPVTLESPLYTPGFLRTQIGKIMRVEFLVGTNGLTDRTGTLIGVGASYILLRLITGEIDGGNTMMCDIYSIKFATIVEPR